MSISAEENKLTNDFVDTASSQFYSSQTSPLSRKQTMQEATTIQSIEEQIARIRETLAASQSLIQQLQSNEQLSKYVEEVEQQLAVVRARSINEMNNAKLSFEKNFSSLERELTALRKSWQAAKQAAETQIQEEIENFKGDLLKDQNALNKIFASATRQTKGKINELTQEIKETKRLRRQSRGLLMRSIEQSRARLQGLTQSQRRRRNEYDGIVLGLLDRTVDQGERIMRRIC